MEEKNIMNAEIAPPSLCQKLNAVDLEKTITFVTFSPLLNGFTRTVKNLKIENENIQDDLGNFSIFIKNDTNISSYLRKKI